VSEATPPGSSPPPRGRGLGWKGLVGFVISAVLVWYTLRGVSLSDVWASMRRADLGLLTAAVTIATAGYLVRAMRWKVLLHPLQPDTRLRDRFAAVNIGFMANNLLPARVGEFARAYAFSRLDARVSVSGAFGTLVVERALDGIVLAGFLAGAVLTPGFPELEPGSGFTTMVRWGGAVLGVLVAGLALLLIAPRPVIRAVEALALRVPERVGRVAVDALHSFLAALGIVRSPVLLGKAFAWTIFFWLFHGTSFWLGMLAFDIHAGPVAALFTEGVVGFGVALPAAPGFFGTFHAAAALALSGVYGVPSGPTLAFAYGYHLGGFVPVTLIGLWYAHRLGMTLSEVGESEARVEEAVEKEYGDAGVRRADAPDPP
jgi:hypothetical protein